MNLKSAIVIAALSLGIVISSGAPNALRNEVHELSAGSATTTLAPPAPTKNDATKKSDKDAAKVKAAKKKAEQKKEQAQARSAKSYKFSVRDHKGRPARWNPCAPIPVIVNLDHAPAHAMRDLKAAVKHINEASGLDFVIKGTTKAKPSADWGLDEWSGARGQWAPVLIAFAKPGSAGLSRGGESGVASPVWISEGGREIFVSGSIVFNYKQNSWYSSGYGKGLYRGALFEHELGHLAGLDHTKDKTQVMYPEIGRAKTYGSGDQNGLDKLGDGGCLPKVDPGW